MNNNNRHQDGEDVQQQRSSQFSEEQQREIIQLSQLQLPRQSIAPAHAKQIIQEAKKQMPLDLDQINLNFSQAPEEPPTKKEDVQCVQHQTDYILFCLKCQEKICTKCLDTNHLLHPVVPLNSVNKLDFKTSLQKEIEKSLEDIRLREQVVQNKIGHDLTKHKVALRNHIIFVRDNLRNDFDNFFSNLLNSIRQDWNLF